MLAKCETDRDAAVLDNLLGIAERINLAKEVMFRKVVEVRIPLVSKEPYRPDYFTGQNRYRPR